MRSSPYLIKLATNRPLVCDLFQQGVPFTAVLDGHIGHAGSEARDRTGLVL